MIEIMKDKHKSIVLELLKIRKEEILKHFPMLPESFFSDQFLILKIEEMIVSGNGFIVTTGGETGFIFSYYLNDMFYQRKGAYTPEWGHYLPTEEHMSLLLNAIYKNMLAKGCVDHSISFFNHNSSLQNYLFENAYGSRCMDGHAIVTPTISNSNHVREAKKEDLIFLTEVLKEHHVYMNNAPIFLGFHFESEEAKILDWLNDSNCKLFIILNQNKPIGFTYLNLSGSGGCESASDEKTLGIETTHILERYRFGGHLNKLVTFYHQFAFENGYTRIAVDYETMNYKAKKSWSRYFTETIRSCVRNIGN
ncbi:MAG: GNAT family N-acetyltransferase [Clostridia bacterium]|nr:GNAT family N-acetyltransferase [Clostridia bacterium]